jgi:hypothetical protein
VFDGEGSSELLLTISGKWAWGGSKMTISMTNWNKECIQLRTRGSLMGRHCNIVYDDIEVGRILANLPKNSNSTSRESYTISTAAYGTWFSLHLCPSPVAVNPATTVDIVLMVVICLCLNDRSYED